MDPLASGGDKPSIAPGPQTSEHGTLAAGRESGTTGGYFAGLGGVRTIRSAKEKLREQGPAGDALARRIGRATKARNWSAHPDARLLVRDVENAVKASEKEQLREVATEGAVKFGSDSYDDLSSVDEGLSDTTCDNLVRISKQEPEKEAARVHIGDGDGYDE